MKTGRIYSEELQTWWPRTGVKSSVLAIPGVAFSILAQARWRRRAQDRGSMLSGAIRRAVAAEA